jgi:uncharacterized protein HemX
MAYPINPNDPYRPNPADDEMRRASLRDGELQVDPELSEGSTSGGRVALYALGAALVLGLLFYGFNNSTTHQAGTTPASQSAQTEPASPPAAPPGMRDVTPRAADTLNNNPGTTTGAAPARPAPPAGTPGTPPAPPK